MQFWQSTFLTEAEHLFEVVKIAEEVGFDGVMVSDHLVHFENIESDYPYTGDGKPPMFSGDTVWPESWSIISALSAVTERVKFVTNVYILPLRHPVEVAKAVSSVASFAEGRVVLGAGAGWMKEEFELLGVDFHTRGKRFNESIEVCRKLWTGEVVEHHGEFFEIPPMQMCPVPKTPIPIYIGGKSNAALRRTARLGDGWLGPGQTVDDAIATAHRVYELRAEYGRSEEPFDFVAPITEALTPDTLARMGEAGITGTVSYPFAFTVGPGSTIEQKRAYMEQYANNVIGPSRG